MDVEEIEYSLATINSPEITAVRQLSEEDYNKFLKYFSTLSKLSFDEGLFQIVELNYSELTMKLEHLANSRDQIEYLKAKDLLLNINRLVLNLLSSIRMYLDHTETKLKREFGATSAKYQSYKQQTSQLYDSSFAYRFLHKLRNYTQHCGLPAGSFQNSSEIDASAQIGFSFKLFLTKKDLLEQFDSWTTVKPEIEAMDDKFDIVPLIKEKFLLLKEVNEKLNASIYGEVNHMGFELLELMWETKEAGGIPCLIKTSGPFDRPNLKIQYFPFDTISKITGTEIQIIVPDEM